IARIEREARTRIGEWEPPEERLEHAPRPRRREHGEEPQAAQGGDGTVKLFLNRGARSGIAEEDVRWALTEGAVIPEDAIASIRVLERFSFVELDGASAERALERLDGSKLKGRHSRLGDARSSAPASGRFPQLPPASTPACAVRPSRRKARQSVTRKTKSSARIASKSDQAVTASCWPTE